MSDADNLPRFDTSLFLFVRALASVLGPNAVEAGWVLRNSEGRLTFITSESLTPEMVNLTTSAAADAVGQYCLKELVVVSADQPGISALVSRSHPYHETVPVGQHGLRVRMIDQRIVGADWLRAPTSYSGAAQRYAFASIKGGVGRTTALAVVATDFAEAGRKVLVVDLDLEAPGVGAMLLAPDELPRFGMLDGYVERALLNMDQDFLFDMSAPSPFGRGKGLIDVVPAVGKSTQEHPANALAKLARAYVDSPSPNGGTVSFSEQTRWLVDSLASLKQYDVVLVDARAGLNESTAAALLGLGAQVFLFGEDTPQTFAGYRYLLAHLAHFPRDAADDWMSRLKMVHAKASAVADRQQAFRDKAYDIFKEFLYQDIPLVEGVSGPTLDPSVEDVVTITEFSLDDVEGPHFALPILRDSNYFEFDPLSAPSQLTQALYERTYGALLDRVNPARDFKDLTDT